MRIYKQIFFVKKNKQNKKTKITNFFLYKLFWINSIFIDIKKKDKYISIFFLYQPGLLHIFNNFKKYSFFENYTTYIKKM